MDVFVVETPQDVAERAAAAVLVGLAEGVARRGGAAPVLGLATGSSPVGLYEVLAREANAGRVDFTKTTGFALDEYVGLPDGHEESYRTTLERLVSGPLGMPLELLNVPAGSGTDLGALRAGAAAYEQMITDAGGIDVQILGIGTNGHLGFNEPGSSLQSRTRVKRLSHQTRLDNARFFGGLDEVPTHCVTQGLGTIDDARRLVLVATGTGKAEAIAAACEGPLSASCPGSVLQWHPDVVVVVDEAAGSLLRNREYYDAAAEGL